MKKKIGNFFRNNREALNSHAGKIGGYSFILTVIVLAVIVAANVVVRLLPSRMTQFDISSARLYSLTSSTKVVVNNLDQKVTIYWITQNGEEDEKVERLLNVYDGLSDKVKVVKKNPDVYPTFAKNYTDEEVANNSLIVVAGDRSRYVSYDSIYEQDYSNYYTTGQGSTSFDGEGQITAAINYVVTKDLPKVYLLSGHGEADLSDSFTEALNKQNIETDDISLLTDDISDDCDAILINAPTSDISDKEVDKLQSYLDDGGHIFVMSGPQKDDELTNLESLLKAYDVSSQEGIVIEGDTEHYTFNMPYLLLANLASSNDITDPLSENGSNVIVPIGKGLKIESTDDTTATVNELLSTSDEAYSKVKGYDIETYEKEKGDVDGPFSLAVSIEDASTSGKIVWIGSDNMLDDTYDSYSSGANTDFVMNALSWMVGEQDSIAIRSKSMDYNYLSINESQASIIKLCMIGIIPLIYLLFGIEEVIVRRKKGKA